ncbi:hypothetical protein F5Y12DRAFT_796517 [Xylaria sp. FL1777]|nr:hypothetical protein F5Y12DRAFT_796517 [Xylaria sp. FL1777]
MDQDNEQEHAERGKVGRPHKPVSLGGRGHPRKHIGGVAYQARGLRAPKTKVFQPPNRVMTRLRTGQLQPQNYYELDELGKPKTRRADRVHTLDCNMENITYGHLEFDDFMRYWYHHDFPIDEKIQPKARGKRPIQDSEDAEQLEPPARRVALPTSHDMGRPASGYPADDGGKPNFWDRPTASLEDEHTLTGLEINHFFPSSDSYLRSYDLRGSYWTKEIEKEFRELWVREEHDSRFEQGPQVDSDELELWKMMLIRYRKIPPQLFTYGLRLGEDCYETPGSIMLSSRASYLLQRICAHQVWGENIDSLRHVLQAVAVESIGVHPSPIGPPPNITGIEDSLNRGRVVKEDLIGVIQYGLWTRNQPDDKLEIYRLISQLQGKIGVRRNPGDADKSLFIVTESMMEDFLVVLDQFDRGIYSSTTRCIERFRHFYGGFLDRVQPRDNRQLVETKWLLELCELRDIEIRKMMRMSDQEDDFLHDVPHSSKHCYEVPLYHHHQLMDKRALPVLRGEVIDPKRATLQGLDRVNHDRARALNEFTTKLVYEVLLKKEPSDEPGRAKESAKVKTPTRETRGAS